MTPSQKEERLKRKARRLQEDQLMQEGKLICKTCDRIQPLSEFYQTKGERTGYKLICKECHRTHIYLPNKAKIIKRVQAWQEKNHEKLKDYYITERTLADKKRYNLMESVRRSILKMLKKQLTMEDYLSCPARDMIKRLESLWKPGMTWETYGHGEGKWQLDHIIPNSAFDASKPNHIKWSCHYRNLQPLWWRENQDKAGKLSNGISATVFKRRDPNGFHQLVGESLEKLGIATKAEYLVSVA